MKKLFLFLLLILVSLSFRLPVFAQGTDSDLGIDTSQIGNQLQAVAGEKGADFGQAEDPRMIVANIIKIALSVLGIIFLVYIFYAGFLWMTAGGDEEKVTSAKKTIKYAVIGTLIVLSSYSITIFVQRYLYEAQNLEPFGGGSFFQVQWGVEEETTKYYPGQDPLGGDAFAPGYDSVWGSTGEKQEWDYKLF